MSGVLDVGVAVGWWYRGGRRVGIVVGAAAGAFRVVHVVVTVRGRRGKHVVVVEVGVGWLDAVELGVVVVAVVANVVVVGSTSWSRQWSSC